MNFYFFIGWDSKEYAEYINKTFAYPMDLTNSDGNCLFCNNENGTLINCIWIRNKDDMPTLAHEVTHAACNTLRERGWNPDFSNEEPLTYLVENIFREALK